MSTLHDMSQSAGRSCEDVRRALDDLSNAASCETVDDLKANLENAKVALREALDDITSLLKVVNRHKTTSPFKIGSPVRVKKYIGRRSVILDAYINTQGTKLFVLADGGHFGADELEVVNT
jgi:hypothetical protein